MNFPAGTTTISGQVGQSLKEVLRPETATLIANLRLDAVAAQWRLTDGRG